MNKQSRKRIRTFFRIGFIKTLIINFRLLPFKQAIKLPIVTTRAVVLESLSGKCFLTSPARFGQIKIGTFHSDLYAWNGGKTFLKIDGSIFFGDFFQSGVGCSLVVDEGCELHFGNNSAVGAYSKIICRNKIKIGNNFRTAWDVQIFDTNFHFIKNIENGGVKRREKMVVLGNNNWLGNRCTVMPGTMTNDYFIAASNTLCNKDYREFIPSYSLVAGSPAKLIRNNVILVLDKEEKILAHQFSMTADDVIYADKDIKA